MFPEQFAKDVAAILNDEMSPAEERKAASIAKGNDPKWVLKQLKEAKGLLDRDLARLFGKGVYDPENKRLIADNGRLVLEWRVRLYPDQPESYDNQQTNRGTVVCVVPDPIVRL